MSVVRYSISLLTFDRCELKQSLEEWRRILSAWRNKRMTKSVCETCQTVLNFTCNFKICCRTFYFNPVKTYKVQNISIHTPGEHFLPPALKRVLDKANVAIQQDFVVVPDPQFWLIQTTLAFDRLIKFVLSDAETKNDPEKKKAEYHYNQIMSENLNMGSLKRRSEGKGTLFRQVAIAKRANCTVRAMIVPGPHLRPNEVCVPEKMDAQFQLLGQWMIFNRMPTLTPESFVALRVVETWPHDCLAIPLEIAGQLNADFDGDEINGYVVSDYKSQAECLVLLNSESNMHSFTSGIKLSPCHDMLVAFHLRYEDIDFLPHKCRDLHETFRTIYETSGSRACFEAVDRMRRFYLDYLQREKMYCLTLAEINRLIAGPDDYERFRETAPDCCLVTQILSKAKGTFYHLYQLVKRTGEQAVTDVDSEFGTRIESSYFAGLSPSELVIHAQAGTDALIKSASVWQPGYHFFKLVHCLKNLIVDHAGRLMDGSTVIANDALSIYGHTDALSSRAFEAIVNTWFK